MIDVVIPYKRSRTDELIYTLRSLKNFRHKNVWIIGDKPRGVDLEKVRFLPFRQTADIAQNTLEILNIACKTPEISDDFVWWHDDMYCMEQVSELPLRHRGSSDGLVQHYASRPNNYYTRRLKDTTVYLKSIGISSPVCYEVHMPFKINKAKWLALKLDNRYNKLSVYGNVYNLGGTELDEDVKVRTRDHIPAGPFVSSFDHTFGRNSLGNKVRGLFPEKGQYEI